MIELPGAETDAAALTIQKAKELASYLSSGRNANAELVGAVADADANTETIIFDAKIEVSQVRVYAILPLERLAVTFTREDRQFPDVLSLREDFPFVPHLALREQAFPRGLCLYESSYEEVKLRWTPASFVEWIREWLSRTAEGRLHGADQPLEPILIGGFLPLLLPSRFYERLLEEGQPKSYGVVGVGGPDGVPTAYKLEDRGSGAGSCSHLATVFLAGSREHGIVHRNPSTLRDLIELCEEVNFDLRAQLRMAVPEWKDNDEVRRLHLILIILFPKSREANAPPTSIDALAFVLQASIEDIGIHLGLWERIPGHGLGALLGQQAESTEAVPICILNPMEGLTKQQAARLNGDEASGAAGLLIGVGALGSKVFENLLRKGFGAWRVVDKDVLLPHNTARHLLPGQASGYAKVLGVETLTKTIYEDIALISVMKADVLRPGDRAEELKQWVSESSFILDCSADVPIARHLALDAPGDARRVSLFLNPTGEDLVLLAEDIARTVRLDELEMQYYGLLLHEPDLAGHLAAAASKIRYGRSCRDLSAILSNDAITRNAAVASRFLPQALGEEDARIQVWKSLEDGGQRSFLWPVAPSYTLSVGPYSVTWDESVMEAIRALRRERLPRETGGALLGQWDHSRKRLYLVATTPAPVDSVEEPTSFVRGVEGLQGWVDEARERTGGNVTYLGEWHSHPDGYSTAPSLRDERLFLWLRDRLAIDSLPAVMLIVGAEDWRWRVDDGETVWKFVA